MKPGQWLEQILGLGASDSPKPVHVAARARREHFEIVSTPGARIRLGHHPDNGSNQLALLACLRARVPVQLDEGGTGIFLDGQPIEPLVLRGLLRANTQDLVGPRKGVP